MKNPPSILEPHTKEIENLYNQGMSSKKIAYNLGKKYSSLKDVTVRMVRRHRERKGILPDAPRVKTSELSKEQEKEMLHRFSSGELASDLSKEYGIHPATIRTKAKLSGISRTGKKPSRIWTDERIKKHDELTSKGVNSEDIARRLGVSYKALRNYRSKTGKVKTLPNITPEIENKIKEIRSKKITYTDPQGNPRQTYPGINSIQRELYKNTGQQYSSRHIQKVIKQIKESIMIKEDRVKSIVKILNESKRRKYTSSDKIEHARHAYRLINKHVEELKKAFKDNAHPDVQNAINAQLERSNSVLNSLNKMGTGSKVKKGPIGFLSKIK